MKIFGYLDDALRMFYHLFDFIANDTIRKLVFILICIILLWILSKFFGRRQ